MVMMSVGGQPNARGENLKPSDGDNFGIPEMELAPAPARSLIKTGPT